MGARQIIHLRDLRLRNNAGMDFPTCYAGAALLDTDKSRLASSGDASKVTCKRCLTSKRNSTPLTSR